MTWLPNLAPAGQRFSCKLGAYGRTIGGTGAIAYFKEAYARLGGAVDTDTVGIAPAGWPSNIDGLWCGLPWAIAATLDALWHRGASRLCLERTERELALLGIEAHQRAHNCLQAEDLVLGIPGIELATLDPLRVALLPQCEFALSFGYLFGK
jgi:hypothetical protein